MLLMGKIAVVTGSNRGIGKEIVEKLALEGARIFACARTKTDSFEKYLQELSTKTGVEITPVYFDMNNHLEMREAVKKLRAFKQKIDILINNMGVAGDTLFQMTKKIDAEKMMATNFFSTFEFTQYIVKIMNRATDSSIINITSVAAQDVYPGMVSYAASKAALESFTRTLSKELGVQKIRVNAVAPGFTDTEMIDNAITNEAFLTTIIERTSLKRLAKPEEIAKVVLFLASDLSSYMTGQIIRVDGGLS